MPAEGFKCLPKQDIISDDEIVTLVEAFAKLGVKKVKLTGGEPLVRNTIISLIQRIKAIPGIEQVTMTTNGVLLSRYVKDLKAVGLDGLNISLDTLDKQKFASITRRDQFEAVMAGINEALSYELPNIKLNVVLAKELNGEELLNLVELAHFKPLHVRFIELMPFGYAKDLTPISSDEVLELLQQTYQTVTPTTKTLGNGPAVYYDLPDFLGSVGFISAMSHVFCSTCNRVRITAEGDLKTCLHFKKGLNLRPYIHTDELESVLIKACQLKQERHHFNDDALNQEEFEQKSMAQIGG